MFYLILRRYIMCVIIELENNKDITKREFHAMWQTNSDGAGLCWFDSYGRVRIDKGYLDEEDFWEAYTNLRKRYNGKIGLHFRIGTSGRNTSEFTHPFPISNSYKEMYKRDLTCDAACFHNGIIYYSDKDIDKGTNDTQTYIKHHLYPMWNKRGVTFLDVKKNRAKIERDIVGSKLLIFTKGGRVDRLGEGWIKLRDGVYVSNNCWQWRLDYDMNGNYKYRNYVRDYVYDYDDDYYYNEYNTTFEDNEAFNYQPYEYYDLDTKETMYFDSYEDLYFYRKARKFAKKKYKDGKYRSFIDDLMDGCM